MNQSLNEVNASRYIKLVNSCGQHSPQSRLPDFISYDSVYYLSGCKINQAIKENGNGWITVGPSMTSCFTFDGEHARLDNTIAEASGMTYKITYQTATQTEVASDAVNRIYRKYTEVEDITNKKYDTIVEYFQEIMPQSSTDLNRKRNRNFLRQSRNIGCEKPPNGCIMLSPISDQYPTDIRPISDQCTIMNSEETCPDLNEEFDKLHVYQQDSSYEMINDDKSSNCPNIQLSNGTTSIDDINMKDFENVEKVEKILREDFQANVHDLSLSISKSDSCEEPRKKGCFLTNSSEKAMRTEIVETILEIESEGECPVGKFICGKEYLGRTTYFPTEGTTFTVADEYEDTLKSEWKNLRQNKKSRIWSVPYYAKLQKPPISFIFMFSFENYSKQQFKSLVKLLPNNYEHCDPTLPFKFSAEFKMRVKPTNDFEDGFSDPVIGQFKCDNVDEYSTHVLIPLETDIDDQFPEFHIKIIN